MSDRRLLLVVVCAALGLFAVVFGVLKPRATEAADLREQLASAQNEEFALNSRLAALQDLERRRPELEAEAERLSALLPQHPHMVRFIRVLNRAANRSGIDLRQMAPSEPSEAEQVNGAKGISMSLIAIGSYDRIESFAAHLESLERAVKVTSITVAPSQELDGNTSLTATIMIQMYSFDPMAPAGDSASTETPSSEQEAA